MVVRGLALSVAFCAGLGMVCAGAAETGEEPVSVAVPVSDRTSSPKADEKPEPKEGPAGKTNSVSEASAAPEDPPMPRKKPAGEEDAAPGPQAALDDGRERLPADTVREPGGGSAHEEEYLPLDLPPAEDETSAGGGSPPEGGETPESDPAVGESPATEAVLGSGPESAVGSNLVHAEIRGIPNSEGVVSASLCTRKNFTKSGCLTKRVPARQGQVRITFDGVRPGVYAVQVHHDQNDNGKMDFTFLGLPKEPYGFSRDAKPMLAPPKFRKASFEVTDSDVSLVINLQNT